MMKKGTSKGSISTNREGEPVKAPYTSFLEATLESLGNKPDRLPVKVYPKILMH